MKISTRGRYALRLMLDMVLHQDEGNIPIREIAKRQVLPVKYLEQIIAQLSRAGYVKSVRGAGGGYHLACDPEKTTVGDILRATEGSLAPAPCTEGGVPCRYTADCLTAQIFLAIGKAVDDVVDRMTLAGVVRDFQSKGGGA
ncbi:MAG TPA: Rrf2 family transcriptional regulator [Oscillospiraceae bacterium]|nr:Rrf2 family transcriptional regulator [Oscillospiraceae bacterium]